MLCGLRAPLQTLLLPVVAEPCHTSWGGSGEVGAGVAGADGDIRSAVQCVRGVSLAVVFEMDEINEELDECDVCLLQTCWRGRRVPLLRHCARRVPRVLQSPRALSQPRHGSQLQRIAMQRLTAARCGVVGRLRRGGPIACRRLTLRTVRSALRGCYYHRLRGCAATCPCSVSLRKMWGSEAVQKELWARRS